MTEATMTQLLLGAIGMAEAVVGLIFLSYYRRTRDRFFLFFTASFWLDAVGRIWIGISPHPTDEGVPFVYILRVVTYALIVVAIVDKNRGTTRG
jgi:hypothetical protein